MRSVVNFVAGAALVAACAGAACSSVPENRYFTLSYTLLPQMSATPLPVSIRMRPFDIAPAYDQERLVYRYSPYEFQYYNYMLWAVKPQKMLSDLFLKQVAHAGRFAAVAAEFGDLRPEYELTGEVEAIEELDSGDQWFAHLAITLRLSRYGDEKPVWNHHIDARKEVFNKLPVYVVKALSELMEGETDKAIQALEAFLRETPKGREPDGAPGRRSRPGSAGPGTAEPDPGGAGPQGEGVSP
jgi:ABC-type uncharacterized transport system auxiliary subunit